MWKILFQSDKPARGIERRIRLKSKLVGSNDFFYHCAVIHHHYGETLHFKPPQHFSSETWQNTF